MNIKKIGSVYPSSYIKDVSGSGIVFPVCTLYTASNGPNLCPLWPGHAGTEGEGGGGQSDHRATRSPLLHPLHPQHHHHRGALPQAHYTHHNHYHSRHRIHALWFNRGMGPKVQGFISGLSSTVCIRVNREKKCKLEAPAISASVTGTSTTN